MFIIKHIPVLVAALIVLQSVSIADWYLLPSPTSANIVSISLLNKDTLYICCSNGGVYRTLNGGINWTLIRNTEGNIKIQFINNTTGFLACTPSLLKTTNAGINWSPIGNACDFTFINGNTGWMACGDSLVRRTTNSGGTWESHGNLIPGSYHITDLAALSSDTALVTVQQSGIYPAPQFIGVFKTVNAGINWNCTFSKMQVSGLPSIGPIYFYNSNYGWFHSFQRQLEWMMYHYVYISGNGGNSWGYVQLGDVIAFGFGSPFTGWISIPPLMFYTTNSGSNWILKNIPTTNAIRAISMINEWVGYCAGDGGTIMKTTDGGGIYTSISINENYANTFSLAQNYPNPFNPTTEIKFSIPDFSLTKGAREMTVRLVIYDLLGREVATPVNQQLKPGTYEIEWDGSNYTSGVYYYKLTVGEITKTMKMVLLK